MYNGVQFIDTFRDYQARVLSQMQETYSMNYIQAWLSSKVKATLIPKNCKVQ